MWKNTKINKIEAGFSAFLIAKLRIVAITLLWKFQVFYETVPITLLCHNKLWSIVAQTIVHASEMMSKMNENCDIIFIHLFLSLFAFDCEPLSSGHARRRRRRRRRRRQLTAHLMPEHSFESGAPHPIVQWIRVHLSSYCPGFESQVHHLYVHQFIGLCNV